MKLGALRDFVGKMKKRKKKERKKTLAKKCLVFFLPDVTS